jgi:hypothetical protein
VTSLTTAIFSGEYDDQFDLIVEAIKERKKTLAKQKLFTLVVGDKVRLVNVSPKYLDGAVGTITGRKGQKFLVALDEAIGRFNTEPLAASPAILEKL